ncbi:protein MpTOMOSYN11 [Marchantia polymorpha subsp. ruderalis]|uniref:Tomo of syntaxin 11 n=1 Tax=Marchantia polymorpha TaxID=3197 RepID=A0A0H5BKL6_MARPO|nr:hypothetical protein MARPO_0063s0003 [Marchantia polymorpha]BAS01272.1 tomo of syntaxin 11 [Marchantia polymorpha]BBN19258.1 hypothetical protein Mp_8g09160 [Marchantia polymorpha subsp. ruderalis]|eukprot:PTQ36453.1 hypothetical protein MARPO_0063s0003 [Marchantia polymorpha]
MFIKRFLQKAGADTPAIPAGGLKASHLHPQLAAHHGIFHSASILAYEPVQRLLAVASTDGRVKLQGADGIEALLQSRRQVACKFLEFMNNRGFLLHINTQNEIEVWDYERKESVYLEPWDGDITSFYVLQGSPFMLLGEHSGLVVVLQYAEEEKLLKRMSYGIPAHIPLGGLVRAGSQDAPCVVSTLAQPDVLFSRVLIAYGNGLIILWGLHENQVLAVRGGTENQRRELSNFANSLKGRAIATSKPSDDDEEEQEICCMCWVCPVGSVVAVGYTNGDILLWGLPTIIKAKGLVEMELVEGPAYSGVPIRKLDLAHGMVKMPVVGLTWCASGTSTRGASGRLYVFGGGEVGRPEALMVLSLDSSNPEQGGEKLLQWDLTLQGPFADMALLPPWPAGDGLCTPAAALVLLMSPGLLHVYDELSIASYFASLAEGTPSPPLPQPVPLQLHVTETNVTCAKLVLVSNDGVAARALLQMPPVTKSSVPSTLPAGTKWPISGGKQVSTGSSSHTKDICEKNVYVTGHRDGVVNFWDAASPSYNLLCSVTNQSKLGGNCPVTTMEFCSSTGLLATGDEHGMVFVYRLQKENSEVRCRFVTRDVAETEEELQKADGIFGCILVLKRHEAPIRSVALASSLFRLAVGDERGKVSMVDLQSKTVILYANCFSNHPSSILSLAFSAEYASTSIPQSPASSSPRIRSQQDPTSHVPVLYVLGKDANMVAYDGSTGIVVGQGPFKPMHSSTAVSFHLLDADGTPICLPSPSSKQVVEGGTEESESAENESNSSEEPSSVTSWTCSEAHFLLLCCTDSLRLYATSAIVQGHPVSLKKIKLEKTCCWTSAFREKTNDSGLILLFTNGDIEFRSLPDLECVKDTSLSECVKWKIELNEFLMKTLGSNIRGQLVLIDHGREVVQISCLEEDSASVQLLPQPQLYDRDVALADEHASAARNIPKKKSNIPGMEGLLKGVVGGVIKELKNALDPEVQHVHSASELPKLFSTRPFTIPLTNRPKSEVSSDNLDIDDIDVDDMPSGPTAAAEPSSGGGFGKFRWSLKGKEKTSHEAEGDRTKLFEGGKEAPKARTADDIRAKYGHQRKTQEVSSVMEMARNKLMERGEKLQGIENRTSELEDNAENFASMAEELAKRMAAKKWWEL